MEKDTIKALVLYISPNIISVLIAFILIELKHQIEPLQQQAEKAIVYLEK